MGLKAVLDSLEGIDESLHDLYEKKQDGKYYLQVDGVDQLPEVAGLKTNRDALLAEKKKIADEMKKYEDVDPEKYQELLKRQQKLEAEEAKGKGDWEAREKQLIEKHQEELEKKDGKINALSSSLESALIESAAIKAIEKEGGNVTLLLPHVKSQTRIAQDSGGEHYAEVVDANGNPRIADGQGNPMTVEQLVTQMKGDVDTFGAAFKANGNSGSGADPDAEGGGGGSEGTKSVSLAEAESGKHLEDIAAGKVVVTE